MSPVILYENLGYFGYFVRFLFIYYLVDFSGIIVYFLCFIRFKFQGLKVLVEFILNVLFYFRIIILILLFIVLGC